MLRTALIFFAGEIVGMLLIIHHNLIP